MTGARACTTLFQNGLQCYTALLSPDEYLVITLGERRQNGRVGSPNMTVVPNSRYRCIFRLVVVYDLVAGA
jgi:hypothetical protein